MLSRLNYFANLELDIDKDGRSFKYCYLSFLAEMNNNEMIKKILDLKKYAYIQD